MSTQITQRILPPMLLSTGATIRLTLPPINRETICSRRTTPPTILPNRKRRMRTRLVLRISSGLEEQGAEYQHHRYVFKRIRNNKQYSLLCSIFYKVCSLLSATFSRPTLKFYCCIFTICFIVFTFSEVSLVISFFCFSISFVALTNSFEGGVSVELVLGSSLNRA